MKLSSLPKFKPLAKGEKPFKGIYIYGIHVGLEHMPARRKGKR